MVKDESKKGETSLMCHQCQRNDKGRVVHCTACKTKRFCEPCMKHWYFIVANLQFFNSILYKVFLLKITDLLLSLKCQNGNYIAKFNCIFCLGTPSCRKRKLQRSARFAVEIVTAKVALEKLI